MKKHSFTLFFLLCLLTGSLLFFGCGVYTDISVSEDSNINFSTYKTFAWLYDDVDTSNSPYNNDIIRNNLKNYFGKSFNERGFKVELDTPDVLLQIVITNKNRANEINFPPQPNPYYECSYYYCSIYYSPNQYDYYYRNSSKYCYTNGSCSRNIGFTEGSITLNVVDRKLNRLVWSGTAKGDIYDPEYIDKDIHPAVLRIMKKFPVKEIKEKEKKTEKEKIYSLKR